VILPKFFGLVRQNKYLLHASNETSTACDNEQYTKLNKTRCIPELSTEERINKAFEGIIQ
jgi:hypothetical protein